MAVFGGNTANRTGRRTFLRPQAATATGNEPEPVGEGSLKPFPLTAYSLLAFPLAFAGLPIYLHAPDFYAVTLQVSLATLGPILLLLRTVDALQDPFIGSLSDRFHDRRAEILLLGAALLATGFYMLFNPVKSAPLVWFALSVLICTTGFSIVSINFQALGGLWHTPSQERTRITTCREAFGLTGLLIAATAPSLLADPDDPASALHRLSLIFLPLLAIACGFFVYWMRTVPLKRPRTHRIDKGWRYLMRDRWRRLFFSFVFLNTFAGAIPAVLVIFFIRDRLGAENLTGLFLLLYFFSGALSMPLWARLARHSGKMATWRVSVAAAIVTFFWAAFLGQGDVISYGFVCAFSGLSLGADLALPPAILADHIDADSREHDASRLFAVMTFLSKSSLAVATGCTLPLLGLFGYVPREPLTLETEWMLSFLYAGLPCAMKLVVLSGLLLLEKDLSTNRSAM